VLDAAEIEATVKKWPKIRFILSGNNYGEELWLTDFLQRYENVDMEISGAEGFRSVNYIVGAVGYRRVLFGAGVPLMYPACAVAKLRVLKLPSEQMEAIESGNARRLFQW
jgi:predicted TIM-barrel fold metal-dependent hydrolase